MGGGGPIIPYHQFRLKDFPEIEHIPLKLNILKPGIIIEILLTLNVVASVLFPWATGMTFQDIKFSLRSPSKAKNMTCKVLIKFPMLFYTKIPKRCKGLSF